MTAINWGQSPPVTYHLEVASAPDYHYEIGPIRPPSEGQDRSLLIRVNRNCPWNRCLFCGTYQGKRFEYRGVDEVKRDIDVAKALADGLKAASWALGYAGAIDQEVLGAVIRGTPEVYNRQLVDPELVAERLGSLANVAGWLTKGAKTVFLQDANSVIMRPAELVEVLKHLNAAFPTIERITSYSRAKTLSQRSLEDLVALRQNGLNRLHVGLESGCDEVLGIMEKGVSSAEQISAGQKVKAAGISLSEYYMPGLGGRQWSQKHAVDSANVLNQVDADFIRLRSLIVRRGSLLWNRLESGEFTTIREDDVVDEIELFVENLNCNSYLASDQMSNLLWEVEGQLPGDKAAILEVIRQYKAMTLMERLAFRLQRRTQSFVSVYGGVKPEIAQVVEEAYAALRQEAPDAEAKVELAIASLKQGFV